MHFLRTFSAVAVWIALASPAAAQLLPVSAEIRGGAALPRGDFASRDAGIEAGAGWTAEGNVFLRVAPFISVYGGYGRSSFDCGECPAAGLDDTVTDEGFHGGAMVRLGIPLIPVKPWVRAGAVQRRLTLEGDGGSAGSDGGIGYEAAAGVALSFGPLQISPGVGYRAYTAKFDLGTLNTSRSVDVSHLSATVGLVLGL